MQFSQPSTARLVNRLRILNIVAQNEGLSRADVSRDLNLNKVSTSEIVDQLVTEGLLLETGRRQTSSGRPPTQLALQKEAKSVIAVDIGIRNTSIALVNMGGDILRFERFPTELQPTGEQIAVTVIKSAQKLVSRIKDPKTVSGLAVALNGIVEPATGTISSIPDWQWENVPLMIALKRHLPFPVIIENNVRAMVSGERWFSRVDDNRSMFYVNWGEHVGAAWVSDGKVISNDCQFGHLPLAKSGLCRCGAIGCLETLAAGWALAEQGSAHTKEEQMTVKQLCARAEFDPFIDAMIKRACDAMVGALISAAVILRPNDIVIGGGISALPDRYMQSIIQSFTERSPKIIGIHTSVRKTSLGDRAGLMGTAAVALDEFIFKRSVLEQLSHHRGTLKT